MTRRAQTPDSEPSPRPGPPRGTPGRLIASLARIAVAVLLGFSLVLWALQDMLLFHPRPVSDRVLETIRDEVSGAIEIQIDSSDGVRLHGWLWRERGAAPAPLLLYFGGNAEEMSARVDEGARYGGFAVAFVNYRGYGRSGGEPGEDALFADALTVHDRLTARADVDADTVVAMGRSLGSGVAVHLAAHRDVDGVVLVTPYDSVAAVAKRRYPFVPVDLLLRHPFDSLSLAPTLEVPLLVLAAGRDSVIPPEHARTLFDAWAGAKRWILFEDRGHNDIQEAAGYWPAIRSFLARVREKPGRGKTGDSYWISVENR